jgi:ABC-2 type transport system ATP-binding protein
MNQAAARGAGPGFDLLFVGTLIAVGAAVEEGRNRLATAFAADLGGIVFESEFDHGAIVAGRPRNIDLSLYNRDCDATPTPNSRGEALVLERERNVEYAIETRGLAKTYRGGVQALKPLDLQVRPGTRFGLLGPNGAGKSTLVKSLLSIVHATEGEAHLNGKAIGTPEARRGVGYLPEGHRFPRYLTGEGVCHYFGQLAGMSGSQLKEDTKKKLALVGMADWADTKISKYSKGMNQRVGLAQALLGDPSIIFLDEPTDGVDPKGRREIRDVIAEVASHGTTVFFNSHLLSEVEVICDTVAILNKGKLLRLGTVNEIKASVAGGGAKIPVTIRCGALPEALWSRLNDRGASALTQKENRVESFSMLLESEADVTPLIDLLRSERVDIFSVRPEEKQLEDAFIDVITASEEGDEG